MDLEDYSLNIEIENRLYIVTGKVPMVKWLE